MLGNAMPLSPGWTDIVVRLTLTVIAGAAIGLNRQAGGHSAGFRTTVLVGLAACLSMIQANILLGMSGKTAQSFVTMDVLRFPLGVLTGVGFIGGGAILKRGDLVTGVTTAATLWVMTTLGLCFGGGQLLVGCAAAVLVLVVLVPLKDIDAWIAHTQKGRVTIEAGADAVIPDLNALLGGIASVRFMRKRRINPETTLFSYELHWRASDRKSQAAGVLAAIEDRYRIASFEVIDRTD